MMRIRKCRALVPLMKWKGVIFDRDGTLFDSLKVILRSFNYGIEPFTDKRPMDAEWFAAFGPPEPEVMGTFIPPDKKTEAFERFYRYYREHFAEISIFPGVSELLAALKSAGVKMALFTGGGRTSTRFCLEKEKVLSFFDELITGDDVVKPKPDSEGVLKAMEVLSLQPEQTLVVGDAGADILAGKRAGVTTVLARWSGYKPPHDLRSEPDYVFDSLSEFGDFVFKTQ